MCVELYICAQVKGETMTKNEATAQITKDILVAALNKGDINGDISTIIKAYTDIFSTVYGCFKNKPEAESESESAYEKRGILSI